jgi:hypothetical protein
VSATATVGGCVGAAVTGTTTDDPVEGGALVDTAAVGPGVGDMIASVDVLASSSSPEQAPPSMTSAVNAIATERRTAIWAIVACDLRC